MKYLHMRKNTKAILEHGSTIEILAEIARLAQENEKLAKQATDFGGSAFFGSKHQGETK
jgi:hypothetical protein